MKKELSLDQMKEWKRQMDNGVSLAIFRDPQSGKLYAPKSVTEHVSGFFTQLDNGSLLKSSNQETIGVRTITGKKIVTGPQLVYSVRVLCDTTLTGETEVDLIAAPFASVAPVQFKNGMVYFNQNAELLRTTGTDIHNFKASTGNDADFKDVVPFTLRENTDFDIKFKLAGAATANHAYKLEYRAVEFVEITKA